MDKVKSPPKEPYLKDMTMVLHLSMTKSHHSKHAGKIVWSGNPLDGKTLYQETVTPKTKSGNFGKAKQTYYIEGKDTPMFDNVDDLIKHYTTNEAIEAIKKQ